jgi:dTDP-4-amino-4,6-dideoxygalactose transaminase
MNIPILDLKAQYQTIKEEINQKVSEVLSSQSFILGAEVDALEKEIASLSGTNFGIGVSSGSDALIISLMALGIGAGDAVVTTPFTFFATAGAVARVGARTLFCDIDPEIYNIAPERLEELLQKAQRTRRLQKIKAVIPVHLYGQCVDMDGLLATAKRYRLWVIEDAAQAITSEYPSRKGIKRAGSLGTVGTLSFFPSKNLGGYGDGGMVLTNSQKLAAKLKCLRVHGGINKYFYKLLGGNFRLDALQAAVLRVKLKHLEEWQRKRRERAAYYSRKIAEAGLEKEGLVKPPVAVYKGSGVPNYHTYHQYVIRAKKRDELQAYLKERGVGTSIFYPLPLHLQQCFSDLGYKRGDFPISEKAAKEVLALPIYPELNPEQQDWVVSSMREFYS